MPNPTPSDKLKSMAKQAVEDKKHLEPDVDKWAEKLFRETTLTLAMVIEEAVVRADCEIEPDVISTAKLIEPHIAPLVARVEKAEDDADIFGKQLFEYGTERVGLIAQIKRLRAVAEAAKVLVHPIKYSGGDTAYRRNILKIALDALEVGDE